MIDDGEWVANWPALMDARQDGEGTLQRAALALQVAWNEGGDVVANLPDIVFTQAEAEHLAAAVLSCVSPEILAEIERLSA